MDKEGLFTTIVGSWPLSNKPENMIKVFSDLIEVGIDFPCYPQLISMISQFLSPLTKSVDQLEEENEKFYLYDGTYCVCTVRNSQCADGRRDYRAGSLRNRSRGLRIFPFSDHDGRNAARVDQSASRCETRFGAEEHFPPHEGVPGSRLS